MKQNKQPFHLYATDWQIEVNRMSTPKCQEEQIERFIMSLADGRVISALATIVASTTNNTLNNIINSGLKIDRTINGIHNKQKDYSIQPTTQHNQQYDVESSETPMDSEGDTVMGTNRIHQKHSHHGKKSRNSRSNDSQTQYGTQQQRFSKFCKSKSHNHNTCFSRKNPDRTQRAKNYEQFNSKKVHGIEVTQPLPSTTTTTATSTVNQLTIINNNSALDDLLTTTVNVVQQNQQIASSSLPHCSITINNQSALAMLDSGAEISIIGDDLCQQLGIDNRINKNDKLCFQSFNTNGTQQTMGSITTSLYKLSCKFHVIESTNKLLILGIDIMKTLNISRSWLQHLVSFETATTKFQLPMLNKSGLSYINNINLSTELTNVPDHLRQHIMDLFYQFKSIIPTNNKKPSVTNLLECDIELKPGAAPIFIPPKQYPPQLQSILNSEMELLVKLGICTKSGPSEWGAMASLVKKNDGTYRVVGDYRQLNQRTIVKKGIHCNMQAALTSLGTASIFSKLDLASGYWQVPIKKEDRIKTALTTTSGIYYFNVMPFGLVNAPYVFMHLMNLTLGAQQFQHCICYLDDIIIYSNTTTEHLNHIKQVFQALEKANLSIKVSKCAFGLEKVEYLGFIVSSKGVQANMDKGG